MRSCLDLIRGYPRPLSFGFLHAFYSSPGQTFFIAIFVPYIRESFQLQRTEFGAAYSAATLAGAFLLPYAGRLIDRFNLRNYSFMAGFFMAVACWITAWAPSLPLLYLGIFGLRLAGRGLMGHIETVSISRYFGTKRGKALGVTSIGYPVGMALLPGIAAWLILQYGWRAGYGIFGGSYLLAFLPLSAWLLRKEGDFRRSQPEACPRGRPESGEALSLGRREVLRSPYFYFVMPLILFPSFFVTGLLIHQGDFAAYKGWRPEWVAYFFVGYAIMQSLSSFGIGPAVDRFTAKRLVSFQLLPLGTGMLLLAASSGPAAGAAFFALMGSCLGVQKTVSTALWAEAYGTEHLGAIRSLAFTIQTISVAASPGLFGWLLDADMDIDLLLYGGVAVIAGVSVLSYFAPTPRRARAAAEAKSLSDLDSGHAKLS